MFQRILSFSALHLFLLNGRALFTLSALEEPCPSGFFSPLCLELTQKHMNRVGRTIT